MGITTTGDQPPRGFARLTPEERRRVSSRAGVIAQARGVAHRWTFEESRAAALKGVEARRQKRLRESQE